MMKLLKKLPKNLRRQIKAKMMVRVLTNLRILNKISRRIVSKIAIRKRSKKAKILMISLKNLRISWTMSQSMISMSASLKRLQSNPSKMTLRLTNLSRQKMMKMKTFLMKTFLMKRSLSMQKMRFFKTARKLKLMTSQ